MDGENKIKQNLCVLQANSLRGLVDAVNKINQGDVKILKDDIVSIQCHNDFFFLLYYR